MARSQSVGFLTQPSTNQRAAVVGDAGHIRQHKGESLVTEVSTTRSESTASRFDTRALAVQWAEEERKHLEKGGA